MAGLWLTPNTIEEWNAHLLELRTGRSASWTPPAPKPSEFEVDCAELLKLIEEGNAETAGILARKVATKAYDDFLDRNFCEHTGFPYFHECYDDY